MNKEQNINQLPKGWKWVKLGELCDKISLNKIKIKQKDYLQEGTYPVVDQGQDLIGGYYNDKNLVIPNEPPYIVFGDHTKVKKYINFNFVAGADGVKVLKPKDIVDSKFLFYSLFTIKIDDKGYARHFQLLEKELFPFPPKPTQQVIVSKIEELFSELDKGIENLRIAQQQLKIYRQSVLKWAFEGKLTEQWRNVKKIEIEREFWTKLNTNKYTIGYEMYRPSEWTVLPIGNFSDFQQGMQIAKKTRLNSNEVGSLRILRIKNYRDGFKTDVEYIKVDESSLIAEKEDIILTRTGESRGDILTGFKGIFHNNTFRINYPKSHINREFLIYYLSTSKVQNYIKNNSGRTGQPDLTHRNFGPCPVVIPSVEEQQQIVQEIESRLSVADKMEESITQSLQQVAALRQSILKKAFEGKLI